MKPRYKHLSTLGLLAGLGLTAIAQTAAPPSPAVAGAPEQHAHPTTDPARRHEMRRIRMDRRLAELKLQLQIAAPQEAAWTAWTTAMKPAAQRLQRLDRAELERMTTPERIDRMRLLRTQRQAEMDLRMDATQIFYATLNADQKTVFDGASLGFIRGGGHGHRS